LEVILDTNALSAIADGEPGAVAAISKARLIAIPVVVLGEYLFGIAQSRRRAEYERWINESLRTCRVLEISAETAARYAELWLELKRSGTPIPSNDAWIAALCRQYALPVLSQDQHFDLVKGIQRVPW
jgi:predicted nucleic acid-binding protein